MYSCNMRNPRSPPGLVAVDEEAELVAAAGLPLPPRVLPEPVKVQPEAPLRPEAPELSSQVGWFKSITWTHRPNGGSRGGGGSGGGDDF